MAANLYNMCPQGNISTKQSIDGQLIDVFYVIRTGLIAHC